MYRGEKSSQLWTHPGQIREGRSIRVRENTDGTFQSVAHDDPVLSLARFMIEIDHSASSEESPAIFYLSIHSTRTGKKINTEPNPRECPLGYLVSQVSVPRYSRVSSNNTEYSSLLFKMLMNPWNPQAFTPHLEADQQSVGISLSQTSSSIGPVSLSLCQSVRRGSTLSSSK